MKKQPNKTLPVRDPCTGLYLSIVPAKYRSPNELFDRFTKYAKERGSLPFTIGSWILFAGVGEKTWLDWCHKAKSEPNWHFATLITDIRVSLSDQKITGALIGAYSGNLISRLEGLHDSARIDLKQEPEIPAFDTNLMTSGQMALMQALVALGDPKRKNKKTPKDLWLEWYDLEALALGNPPLAPYERDKIGAARRVEIAAARSVEVDGG